MKIDTQQLEALGKSIAGSEIFGKMSASAGQVIALSTMMTGRDPLALIEEFHFMNKKLSLKAEAMLARLVRAGGSYEIVEHSSDAAEIKCSCDGRDFEERFTWEEAKAEPFVYVGKASDVTPLLLAGETGKLTLSANYSTPRRRMQHLWARVVSDAVRVVAPHVLCGYYTPEEVSGFSAAGEPATDDAAYVSDTKTAEVKDQGSGSPPATDQVDSSTSQPEREPDPRTKIDLDGPCTEQQAELVRNAIRKFGEETKPEAITQIKSRLAERGITSADQLTVNQADQMVAAIEHKTLKAFFDNQFPVAESVPS